ncbi:MAG: methionyl-tRNA formyltransferase [Clostridiales bacterium]|nr:methionyl-tRNA formyltransferase [Clostridiales bacterium]
MFMGTPDLAATVLAGLYEAGYELPLVVTQPDKPSGRGRKSSFSPVKAYAVEKELPLIQPDSVKDLEVRARVKEAVPDVIVVAAYGRLLPLNLLEAAPLGCLNVHASLLPAYRGAAPIQWALLKGESETGVTIMQMDEGLDTGPILLQERLTIPAHMDGGGLYRALSDLGAALLLQTLPLWAEGKLTPGRQPVEGVSYAERITRTQEMINWHGSAAAIRNQVRAFSPSPGASATLGDTEMKVLGAEVYSEEDRQQAEKDGEGSDEAVPGQIRTILRKKGPVVATGEGSLLLTRVQPAGKKPMDAWSWLNGSRLAIGERFRA